MDDAGVLVCRPEHWRGRDVPGSTTSLCTRCGCPVWVAPSGRDILQENPRAVIECIPCAIDFMYRCMSTGEEIKIQALTPTQAIEIMNHLILAQWGKSKEVPN